MGQQNNLNVRNTGRPLIDGIEALANDRRQCPEGIDEPTKAACRRCSRNRARGKHQVAAMSDIVSELTKRNWSDRKIAKELGMEPDEVLRLRQITGLAEMFAGQEFSEAWEA